MLLFLCCQKVKCTDYQSHHAMKFMCQKFSKNMICLIQIIDSVKYHQNLCGRHIEKCPYVKQELKKPWVVLLSIFFVFSTLSKLITVLSNVCISRTLLSIYVIIFLKHLAPYTRMNFPWPWNHDLPIITLSYRNLI